MADSSFGRLLGALVSPVATFRSIAGRPTWLAAWLALYLLGGSAVLLAFQKVDFAAGMREQMADQHLQMPAGSEERAAHIGKTFAVFGVLLLFPLLTFVVPAIYLLLNLLGGEIDYKRSLAVYVHANIPRALASLLAVPVVLSRGEMSLKEVQGGGLLHSNLAFLAPADAGPVLRALLVNFDLFTLWTLVLSIVGYHVVGKVSKRTAAAVVLALWFMGLALQVGGAFFASHMRGGH
ncbi:MAG TPA: YIP1 family protein [Thermoanaerobaculia bacterium]|jgi:hypothetical protein|nr:YIP1 family protein [Thermoanaerobaculia bacterium]